MSKKLSPATLRVRERLVEANINIDLPRRDGDEPGNELCQHRSGDGGGEKSSAGLAEFPSASASEIAMC